MSILTDLGYGSRTVQLSMHLQAARYRCHLQCGPYTWELTKDSRVIRISPAQYAGVGELASQFDDLFETLTPSRAGSHELLDFSRLHLHTFRDTGLTFELAHWPEPGAVAAGYFDGYMAYFDDLVFDLGAEFGVFTQMLSKVTKRAIAFEPDPSLSVILERNVARQAMKNVTVERRAIYSFAELVQIYGEPAFCRINLDRIAPGFMLADPEFLGSTRIVIGARSKSGRVRSAFMKGLRAVGFEAASDKTLGLIWARPAGM